MTKYKEVQGTDILFRDLRKGLPFEDESVEVVYSSHFLEHIDRNQVETVIADFFRVLRPGGILRTVVPDLEILCRDCLKHLDLCGSSPEEIPEHDMYVSRMFEHFVRKEAVGTGRQKPFQRAIENLLLGDAASRGQTHRWMYDRANLSHLLQRAGFQRIEVQSYQTSLIPNWQEIGLDLNDSGNEYKPNSLYVESVK